MKLIIEGDKKAKDEWLNTLSITDVDFNNLLSKGVLVGSASLEFECHFVGEIVTSKEYIISLPKIYSDKSSMVNGVLIVS